MVVCLHFTGKSRNQRSISAKTREVFRLNGADHIHIISNNRLIRAQHLEISHISHLYILEFGFWMYDYIAIYLSQKSLLRTNLRPKQRIIFFTVSRENIKKPFSIRFECVCKNWKIPVQVIISIKYIALELNVKLKAFHRLLHCRDFFPQVFFFSFFLFNYFIELISKQKLYSSLKKIKKNGFVFVANQKYY